MSQPASLPVKLGPSNLRPIAYRILSKKHGLNIQTDALAVLTDAVALKFGAEWRSPKAQLFIEEIAKAWKQQDRGIFIDGPALSQVIKELTKDKKLFLLEDSHMEPAKAGRLDTLADLPEREVEQLNWEDFLKFVTPEAQPKFVFDRVRKQFSPAPTTKAKLASTLRSSIEYFNQRYYLAMDRLSRDENFQKATFSSMVMTDSPQVTSEISLIKNVLGRDGQKFTLFGLLSKNINGNYILEDSSDYIELNLKQAKKTTGSFYSTGMLLVVEGIYSASGGSMSNDANVISGCFHVSYLQHPQAERREVSLDAYGHLDFLGIHSNVFTTSRSNAMVKIDKPLKKKLTTLEKTLVNHKLILLGCNVFLDDTKIMAGLKKLFAKLEETIEDHQDQNIDDERFAMVMAGSFVSSPLTLTNGSISLILSSENYKSYFDGFAEMLAGFPLVVSKCKFVLIPGSNDPWQSTYSLGRLSLNALPQTLIPRVFTTRLERLLPKGNLIYGWNPMRINYISQDIVLFRDDLMSKLKRNDIVFQSDLDLENEQLELKNSGKNTDVENLIGEGVHLSSKVRQARQLVKTILDQGDLQPFLKDLRVINTNYQHLMRIEPLPTTIVLFDCRFESFEVTYNGCKVVNLGNLISNQNSKRINYAEYLPATKKYAFKEVYF